MCKTTDFIFELSFESLKFKLKIVDNLGYSTYINFIYGEKLNHVIDYLIALDKNLKESVIVENFENKCKKNVIKYNNITDYMSINFFSRDNNK